MNPVSPPPATRNAPRAKRIKDALFPAIVFLPILIAFILFYLWRAPDGRSP